MMKYTFSIIALSLLMGIQYLPFEGISSSKYSSSQNPTFTPNMVQDCASIDFEVYHQFEIKDAIVQDLGWSSDSQTFIISGTFGIYLYDMVNLDKSPLVFNSELAKTARFALSNNGDLLAVELTGEVQLWDFKKQEQIAVFEDEYNVMSIVFNNDNSMLAYAENDGFIHLRRMPDGELLQTIETPFGLHSLSFSPNNKILYSVSIDDSLIRVWDVQTGTELTTFDIAQTGFFHVEYSPTDDILAVSVHSAKAIYLLDSQTGELMNQINIEDFEFPASFSFSPDGNLIAAPTNNVIKLWNVNTGNCVGQLVHNDADLVSNFVFSPNGEILLSKIRETDSVTNILTIWRKKVD